MIEQMVVVVFAQIRGNRHPLYAHSRTSNLENLKAGTIDYPLGLFVWLYGSLVHLVFVLSHFDRERPDTLLNN